jgi:hypothetical protein
MDSHNPENMARQLKEMESAAQRQRLSIPGESFWERHSLSALAPECWEVVKQCL